MLKHNRFIVSNAMLFTNLLVVWGSSIFADFLTDNWSRYDEHIIELGWQYGQLLEWGYLLIIGGLVFWYERPIRKALKKMHANIQVEPELALKSRQRLLNEPYFITAIDFICWIMIGLIFIASRNSVGVDHFLVGISLFDTILTALIAVTIAFFVLQFLLQKWFAPIFFPEGQLRAVPKTQKTQIKRTLMSLSLAINCIPLLVIIFSHLHFAYKHHRSLGQEPLLQSLNFQIINLSLIFVGLGIFLTLVVSRNLSRPLAEITKVLKGVGLGSLDDRVRVTTNDEIGYTGDIINKMTEDLREGEVIKETFGKYVAQEVRDEVLSGRIPLDGEKKDVTVLFSDLRDFTPMTESNDPKVVIKIMNSYFKEMAEAIQDQGGLVLQFIGDEIYAVFGAPISRPDHPARAFRAGLEIGRRLIELNKEFEKKEWPCLRHGIGIHTGEAIAANIGSLDRLSYLLVGDTINLASRLQSLTKEMGNEMIISSATYTRLTESELATAELRRLPPTTVKGKKHNVEVFAVV